MSQKRRTKNPPRRTSLKPITYNLKPKTRPSSYARAGVDIDKKMAAIEVAKKLVKQTRTAGVISDIGLFGGLFKSPGKDKVLVASTDGVGTKLKVAALAGRHDTVGQDIVNHCVNDILVQGAEPLFFLDYIAMGSFLPETFKQVIKGLCKACAENNCAVLGGETAEMPGLYAKGEYDLAGTIIGVADRKKMILGDKIQPGDVLIGLASTGLHTNGYSLARKIFFDTMKKKVTDKLPGASQSIGSALLAVHKSYLKPVKEVLKRIKVHGMAHITGGGFPDNIVRILPKGVCALIDRGAWKVPAVFKAIQKYGKVDREEMYRVFNMGIGYIIIVHPKDTLKALKILKSAKCPGRIIGIMEESKRGVKLLG